MSLEFWVLYFKHCEYRSSKLDLESFSKFGDLVMRTSWLHGHATHTQRHQFPGKPSKSGLKAVWHKDNLYLSTNTIWNENSYPTNIDSGTRSIKMTSRSQLFFNKSFFSSLENQRRDIIPPTHNKCGKQEVLLIWIV
jgi:hypothetical protein